MGLWRTRLFVPRTVRELSSRFISAQFRPVYNAVAWDTFLILVGGQRRARPALASRCSLLESFSKWEFAGMTALAWLLEYFSKMTSSLYSASDMM